MLEAGRAASNAAKTAAQWRHRVSTAEARSICLLFDLFCESRLLIVLQADTIHTLSPEFWLSCSLQVGVNPIGSYFFLVLPSSSFFCVPDVTPNRLSNSPAVALLILLLRSRRDESERAERVAAKEQAAAKAAADTR